MESLITLVIFLVVATFVVYGIFWALGKAQMNPQLKSFVTIGVVLIVVIIGLYVLVNVLQRAGLL